MGRHVWLLAVILSVSFRFVAVVQAADSGMCVDALVDTNPDQIIKSCTAIIDEWHGSAKGLALTFNTRGNANYDKGLSDRAIEDFDQAIKLNPNDAEAFYGRGSAYYQKGNDERALQEYDQAIKLRSDYTNAYNNRGYIYFKRGDLDRAIQDFDSAIKLDPQHAPATFNRGLTYFARGDCSRAMQDFAKANSLN